MSRICCRIRWFFCLILFSVPCFALPNSQVKTLSLEEAILLAVRENPSIQTSQLNHVMQKFSVEVQRWQLQPHLSLQASRNITRTVTSGVGQNIQSWAVQPTVTWETAIGSQLTLMQTNNLSHGSNYNPGLSLQVIQPLLRGFGKPIVEAALNNAIDSEYISRLNVQNTMQMTVTNVINAYLDVILAQHTVKVDVDALQRAKTSVKQTQLFIQAGRKAGVELVTVKADAANAEAQLENDLNAAAQANYALLTAIGIDPSTSVKFNSLDVAALIKKYHSVDLQQAKERVLEHDIQFQTDNITLHGSTQRSVLLAEDAKRWQLNLTANGVMGNGYGGGQNAGFNSLTNGYNQNQAATLNLTIPIDDRVSKQAVANARIALREAEIALKQERWQKETNAINGWNSISSARRTLSFAENAESLQLKTYQISYQKYSYGLIDSLELQSVQQQLRDRQQSLVNAQINYLKSLVNFDLLMGSTLKTWCIGIKYD